MKKLSESQILALRHLALSAIRVTRVEQRWVGLPDNIRTLRTLEQLAQAGLCRRSFDHVNQSIVFTLSPLGERALRRHAAETESQAANAKAQINHPAS